MRTRLVLLVAALLAATAALAPAAPAQQLDAGAYLFLEGYRILRDESLASPTADALLQGADAGLRSLLREEGRDPAALNPLYLTGGERVDLDQILQRIAQVQALSRGRSTAAAHAAISGMVAVLRDTNSAFFNPEAFAQFLRRTQGDEFVGVGIVIEERAGHVVVVEVMSSTPAAEAGLRAGDVIVAVDGVPTVGLTLDQVSQMIRGVEGTQVLLAVQRAGTEHAVQFMITRQRILQRVVAAHTLASGVGHLRVMQFTQHAPEMVASGLRELLDGGMRGIILDLRGNPGGLLDAAVSIASHFLERGPVVTLDTGRGASTTYLVRPRAPRHLGPLVVLVDRGSASASEVVAGALQDSGIKLVGTRTYGKATVQAIFRLRDGSGLRLTVSRYLTPQGRDVEGRGLQPDVEVATGGAAIGSPNDAPLNLAVSMLTQVGTTSPGVTAASSGQAPPRAPAYSSP